MSTNAVGRGGAQADPSAGQSAGPPVGLLSAHFAAHPDGIVAAYLFGSEARGSARPDSDVDVAILFATPPPHTLAGLPLDLEGDLERLLGRRVEVVAMNTAPVDLIHRVLRDGVLLFEGDRSRRIGFEVQRRNEFFDLEPHLHRYRRVGHRS